MTATRQEAKVRDILKTYGTRVVEIHDRKDQTASHKGLDQVCDFEEAVQDIMKLVNSHEALVAALRDIIAECPNPKLPYGVKVVEIARAALKLTESRTMKAYTDCKFYRAGQCWHVDAPESNRDCIGADACDAQYDPLRDFLRDNAPERDK